MKTKQLALDALKLLDKTLQFTDWENGDGEEIGEQLRNAVAVLEADIAQAVEPMFWVRLRSDGFYEGPIHNAQIEKVRKESGGWTPLYTTTPEPAWQPIATAPKDGVKYLAYSDEWGFFVENQPPKCYAGGWEFNADRSQWRGHAHSDDRSATHWMPLASAPKATS